MLKGKWRLLICIALVACVIFSASNNVFAAINTSYGSGEEVEDEEIDDKVKSSSLLEAIGSLIYSLGSLIELLASKVFKLITGSATFPWADSILFNAVPFLDINIFNADTSSLVYVVQDTLTETYYSILTLASAFFGIAVMFSAVKLVITAIAEDKSKYKKAIVNWLLGLVMLWGMHFFMSFVLYLNEELVRVARTLASSSISANSSKIMSATDTTADAKQVVEKFITAMETVRVNSFVAVLENFENFLAGETYTFNKEDSKNILRANPQVSKDLLCSVDYRDWRFGEMYWWSMIAWSGDRDEDGIKEYFTEISWDVFIQVLAEDVNRVVNAPELYWKNLEDTTDMLKNKENKDDEDVARYNYYVLMLKINKKYNGGSSGSSGFSDNALVVNLAQYFKETAWTRTASSWKNTKVSISNAIMYVIFVCYSIVFFISYTKRLFYVVMLMMMAPVVVVFDFFVRFGK